MTEHRRTAIWIERPVLRLAAAAACGLLALCAGTLSAGEKSEGFQPIFDGKTLKGWDGNPKFWRVEDGAIVGETTEENPTRGNTFLVWRGGTPANFELKLEFRIRNHNSGVQVRSFELPDKKWVVGGYQADIDAEGNWVGTLYGEKFRGVLAKRGQKTVLKRTGDGKFQREVVGSVGDPEQLVSHVDLDGWNEYHIIARGNRLVQKINGHVMSVCTDNDEKMRRAKGLIALQLHAGPPMKVAFRDIRLKRLGEPQKTGSVQLRVDEPGVGVYVDDERVKVNVGRGVFNLDLNLGRRKLDIRKDGRSVFSGSVDVRSDEKTVVDVKLGKTAPADKKRILFIAGRRSHGYGSHEHKAGCLLLARELNESGLPVHAEVHTGGWPKDPAIFYKVDTVVIYSDGGGGHPAMKHLEELRDLANEGVGIACLHYAVEVPKGKPGKAWLDLIGGYFETNWSVNPHWTAGFDKLPDHPVTRGVRPFSLRDEWYYHMRFRKGMQGVTPLLTDLPPEKTLNRPDGAHSNNPHVREAVLEKKEPQHVAWATVRDDGGRGFGFTGGHFHWNWGHDDFRRLVLNAIVWTAGLDVPPDGVPSEGVTVEELLANQDYDQPENFDPKRIKRMLEEWNTGTPASSE